MVKTGSKSTIYELWRFKLYQNVEPYHLVVFFLIIAKSDFLLIGSGTTTHKRPTNTTSFNKLQQGFNKLHYWLGRIMTSIQMVVYAFLELKEGLRNFFQETTTLKNFWNSQILLKFFTAAWPGSGKKNEMSLSHIYLQELLWEKIEKVSFKNLLRLHCFSGIFYWSMTRFSSMSLDILWQCL